MAGNRITPETLAKLHLTEGDHPQWSGSFTEAARCDQVEDDLFAARSVSTLLMAIVTFGALLGTLGVFIAWLI